MLTNVAFHVPGEPQGKGRPRAGKRGSHTVLYTPAKTVAYESLIAHCARAVMGNTEPFERPCALEVLSVRSVPASWSKRKRDAALRGELVPAKKPDADNILKAVGDGGNGVLWRDDAQIVRLLFSTRYGETPGLWVQVASMTHLDA